MLTLHDAVLITDVAYISRSSLDISSVDLSDTTINDLIPYQHCQSIFGLASVLMYQYLVSSLDGNDCRKFLIIVHM